MTYEEFEWHILRMTYEERLDRLQPAFLAYALGLPHETVTSYLEHSVHNGLLEMDVTEDGRLEYFVPGIDFEAPIPKPVWKEDVPETEEKTPETATDGSLEGPDPRLERRVDTSKIPPNLRRHIEERYAGTDGALVGSPGGRFAVIDAQASIEEARPDNDSTAVVPYDPDAEFLPARVESNDEAFCDPSRTMFMRQIRIYGSQSPQMIREQVTRLFQSFGYRVVDASNDRMRFERGSVMFILALVPLFVLVLPLFVYLFLYCMGRSTIQQEPLELDVQFRQGKGREPFWEIDLTFVGLHGVVLGAADQRVLNREIDTLREELRWALQAAS
jgi:hypothetical protein